MSREELIKLADKYQEKADTAFQNYQETGAGRYGSSCRRNEDMAEALKMAAGAADEHRAYISMKVDMANFTRRAKAASTSGTAERRDELMRSLVLDLVAYGRALGFVGEV